MRESIHIHISPIKEFYLRVTEMRDPSKVAAVLCTTSNLDTVKIEGIQYLHVPFADVTSEARPDAFKIEQAVQIRSFLDDVHEATDLYFCCDSGESRSAALAAAWMHYSNQDEMRIWKNTKFHPNELVYYLQSVACGLPITREDALELAEFNRALFHKAISHQYT